jgi:ankyrin repeat protein
MAQNAIRNLVCLVVGILFPAGAAFAQSPARSNELIEAVRAADPGRVERLLANGADPNAPDVDTTTALHVAAGSGDPELVGSLLAAGADPGARTRYDITPIALAASGGHSEVIARLLEAGVEPDSTSLEGQTALMSAALHGSPEALGLLIDRGAEVDRAEPVRGQTALMWAAGEGHAEAVKLLVAAGADLHRASAGGFTPLLFAVLYNRIGAARTLLELGAGVEDTAPDGTTSLNMAAVNGYYDLASLLLDHGADPNAPDPRGSTLHTVAWLRRPGATGSAAVGNDLTGPPVPSGETGDLELVRKLLEHGADPDIRVSWRERPFDKGGAAVTNPPDIQLGRHILTYVGATPYWLAANNGDPALMRLLVEFGADPSIPNRFGVTPLMVAAGLNYYEGETPGPFTGTPEAERLEAVMLALEAGNPIDARADFGDYPILGDPAYTLIYYPTNIDDLADLGVGDPRWDGSTALHGAVVSGQGSIVRYLIDQGADLRAVNDSGWTPLMLSRGFFLANAEKVYPEVEDILTRALRQQGLPEEE